MKFISLNKSRVILIAFFMALMSGFSTVHAQNQVHREVTVSKTDSETVMSRAKARLAKWEKEYSDFETVRFGNDTYTGQVKNGEPHGVGIYKFESGSMLIGEFSDDKRHGRLTDLDRHGAIYDGQWKYDKKHGNGTQIYYNGDQFVGQWREGKRNGDGTFFWENGDIYVGNYKNNRKYGKGTMIYAAGDKFTSDHWIDDNNTDWGKYTYRDGSTSVVKKVDGRWEDKKDQATNEGASSDSDSHDCKTHKKVLDAAAHRALRRFRRHETPVLYMTSEVTDIKLPGFDGRCTIDWSSRADHTFKLTCYKYLFGAKTMEQAHSQASDFIKTEVNKLQQCFPKLKFEISDDQGIKRDSYAMYRPYKSAWYKIDDIKQASMDFFVEIDNPGRGEVQLNIREYHPYIPKVIRELLKP